MRSLPRFFDLITPAWYREVQQKLQYEAFNFIWGSRERVVASKYLSLWKNDFPNATFDVIEDWDHFPMLEDPGGFYEKLQPTSCMSKLSQLQQLESLGWSVPAFTSVAYADFLAGERPEGLRFPVAVRSSYLTEDGEENSQAGQYLSRLNVGESELEAAIADVFNSYPTQEGTQVLVQEMVDPDFSGVLFAFREGSWKLEYTEGLGEALMSGQQSGRTLLLPRFGAWDVRWSAIFNFWKGAETGGKPLRRAFIQLSYITGQLLEQLDARHGLDIEFAVSKGKLWLLQAGQAHHHTGGGGRSTDFG